MSDKQDIVDGSADDKKQKHHDFEERGVSSSLEHIDRNQMDGTTQPSKNNSTTNPKDGNISRAGGDDRHRDKKRSSKKSQRNKDSNYYSNDDDLDSSDSSRISDDRRRKHNKEKKKKMKYDDQSTGREKTSKKRQKSRDDNDYSDDHGDSSSSARSYSDDDRRRRQHNEKKRRKKEKKSKHKKHKKERSRNESTISETATPAAPTFGQYGIIKSSDMSKMQRSFEIWLSEVHGVHLSSSNIPRYELQQYFDTYREDYNTATLPHMKYYNYDKWELEEFERQKREIEQTGQNSSAIINDERNHALEMQRIAKQKEQAALQFVAATMNSTKVEEMQQQKLLQTQMQMAFKMGDHETYRRIKEKLQPPEK